MRWLLLVRREAVVVFAVVVAADFVADLDFFLCVGMFCNVGVISYVYQGGRITECRSRNSNSQKAFVKCGRGRLLAVVAFVRWLVGMIRVSLVSSRLRVTALLWY